MRIWMCSRGWLVLHLISSCMAMALILEYDLEQLTNATRSVLRESWDMRPLL